jgi:hypothetical protein
MNWNTVLPTHSTNFIPFYQITIKSGNIHTLFSKKYKCIVLVKVLARHFQMTRKNWFRVTYILTKDTHNWILLITCYFSVGHIFMTFTMKWAWKIWKPAKWKYDQLILRKCWRLAKKRIKYHMKSWMNGTNLYMRMEVTTGWNYVYA